MTRTRLRPVAPSQEDLLAHCSFLARIPAEARRSFAEAGRIGTIPRHEIICRQGDPVVSLRCVVRGLLRCWLVDVEGEAYTVETAWSGSVSIVSLGGPGAEWPWNVTTVVPTIMFTMSMDGLMAIRRRYCVDEAMMAHAAADYSSRHVWHGLLRSVRLRPRLRMLLRRMGDELGRRTSEGVFLDFPVTQSDLAGLAYVTRDEVGRVMREFIADGLVKPLGRRGLLIPDLDRLHPPIDLPWA